MPEDKAQDLIKTGGVRNFNTRTTYLRNPKFIVPICAECQAPDKYRPQWWLTCSHDPYFTWTDETIPGEAVYEDVRNAAGDLTGVKRLVSQAQGEPVKRRAPNLRQMPLSARHMTGGGLAQLERRWANKGFVRPESQGVAPTCEMRDCWEQVGLKEYKSGLFCSEDHAVLVAADQRAKHLEVLNDEKRAEQLADIAV